MDVSVFQAYLILVGDFIFSHLLDHVWIHPFLGWAVSCSDVFAFLLSSLLAEVGFVICMGWYFCKDTHVRRANGVHSTMKYISGTSSEEKALRCVIRRYPWRHPRVLGSSLVILAYLSSLTI